MQELPLNGEVMFAHVFGQGYKWYMKTLIVDDDLVSRAKMEAIVSEFGEFESVDSGALAVVAFKRAFVKQTPFDMIMLDILMPGRGGQDVLNDIRIIEKARRVPHEDRSRIIMVSASAERNEVINCIRMGCDDYLVKPVNREKILHLIKKHNIGVTTVATGKSGTSAAIETAENREKMLTHIMSYLNNRQINLPPYYRVSAALKVALHTNEDIRKIKNLAKIDLALSANLLAEANKPPVIALKENITLDQAAERLGIFGTCRLLEKLVHGRIRLLPNPILDELAEKIWLHALTGGIAACALCRVLHLQRTAALYTMAMLHDIGRLLIIWIFAELERSGELDSQEDIRRLCANMDEQHTRFGASLLQHWHFPERFINIALEHDLTELDEQPSQEIYVVKFANTLADHMGHNPYQQPDGDLQCHPTTLALNLLADDIIGIRRESEQQLEQVKALLNWT